MSTKTKRSKPPCPPKAQDDIVTAVAENLPGEDAGAIAGRILNLIDDRGLTAFIVALDDQTMEALAEALGGDFHPDALYGVSQ